MIYDDLHLITDWAQVVQLREDDLLTPAELTLIEQVAQGEVARIGPTVPTLKAPQVLIRAALLRYLILGGCKDFATQPMGVTVTGAWIAGKLDLSFTQARGPIDLFNCHIAEQPQMLQLQADGLALAGSTLPQGLNAARLQISGNVALNGARIDGKTSLSGGEIKGHLACNRAVFHNPGKSAFKAQGIRIASSVHFEETRAEGLVSLLGARIGGQVVCIGADLRNENGIALNAQSTQVQGDAFLRESVFEGEVSFLGAEIGGVLDCAHATLHNQGGHALNAQRLVVKEGFIWRRITDVAGAVDLTSAHVGDLWDDAQSWAKVDRLFLSGFRYDVLHGGINVPERLTWLQKGAVSRREFYPQPYEQLAALLRETGHRSDARAIMVAKEKEQRKASRVRWQREMDWRDDLVKASLMEGEARDTRLSRLGKRRPDDKNLRRLQMLLDPGAVGALTHGYGLKQFRDEQRWHNIRARLRNAGSLAADKVFGLVVGYGHKPERSFYMLMALVLIGWLLADQAWKRGDFAPTAAPILISEGWQVLARDDNVANPAQVWSDKYIAGTDAYTEGRDYETFNAVAYAVDLVVPLVALGQEAAWAPSTTRGPWGQWLWWTRWWLITLGWVVTAIGAAAVTGVIRRE
ncbi:hypothetical protein [Yoonia sp. 2307UL14-13]|uniref:hypothetical protein n=1 Tax=Yoonia sp. 2307UL14-13 TaxID=3126506 RepID=UPI0030AFE3AD